ncbi:MULTISPECIES: MgtC/SapB family protein [unclassified Rhizobacter]|uniref:MgtC/SapB family protein n=1 Tax=unclassified Rhizobacter TaxID=2640088 RepID=UPI0006FD1B3F|nr:MULTISPECIES: MgtC/SapB family protein [unclassified Rhizobacter]KQU75931.1 methyltransferase [Rhizobacter sp. Root29]KQW06091.1 methyltransferase [Rhizobacter sp. Root1238]KRB19430.1 methyltransferase [Rhizobacter sp. Root16D2]
MDQVMRALREEFSDLGDPQQITRVLLRLTLAALLGGVLGYERQSQGKAAGVRTHMLVAMGAALFVLVPQQGGMQVADLSRVIQGVVAGVGFLGAGAILKLRSEEQVLGLTTAAGVFMTAAIGVACGLGRESTALLSTLLALIVLALVPRIVDRGSKPK